MESQQNDPRKELMDELAKRFLESAKTLREVARNMADSAATGREAHERYATAAGSLRRALARPRIPGTFTYLEYLEFSSAEEFKRFEKMPPITETDIATANWDEFYLECKPQ